MTYQELVDRSIASMGHPRKYKADVIDGYTQHHIIPRCMGGSNDGENIVYFTPAEHLMAHILLFRENPDNYKLAHAARMMSDLNDNFRDLLVEVVDNEDEFNALVEDVVNAKEVSKARSPECRKKISEIKTGKPLSEEHRKTLSKVKLGNVHLSAETRKKIGDKLRGENSYMFGVPKSDEVKQKISESLVGKMVGGDNPFSHAVFCIETHEIFGAVAEAERYIGKTGVIQACKNITKTCGKYHWMYLDEWESLTTDEQNNIFDYIAHQTLLRDEIRATKRKETGANFIGANNPAARAVICLETKEVFATVKDAVKWCGKKGVGNCCRGGSKTSGGYHWMFYDEYLANKIDNQ